MKQLAQTLDLPGSSVKGRVTWQIVEDGKVIHEESKDNLILDSGLDLLAQYAFADVFKYCAVGTGNTDPAVTQQGLIAESARTNNYLTGPLNCGTSKSSVNVWVLKRTFDFPIGSLNGNYAEIGFSPLGVSGPNLFSRVLIQNAGVPAIISINSTQQLRVIYQLTVTLSPTADLISTPIINGWPLSPATTLQGSGKLQNLPSGSIKNVLSNGLTDTADGTLEPGVAAILTFISSSAAPLAVVGSNADRASGVNSLNKSALASVYIGTKYKDFKMSISTTEANHLIRSIGIGSASQHSYAFVFDQNQTKTDLYTLDLVFRMTWGRD